jgi:hypothetical protein
MRWQTAAVLGVLLATTFSATAREYRVYFLGGQSNMEGYGKFQDLPADSANRCRKTCGFFTATPLSMISQAVGQGFGRLCSPATAPDSFSRRPEPLFRTLWHELSFAKRLTELQPAEGIALIKYARGGSSIRDRRRPPVRLLGCRLPDSTAVNQYDHFLATVRQALRSAISTATARRIRWFPPESCGCRVKATPTSTGRWPLPIVDNLKRLMDMIRAALRVDDLPVVIGRISDSGRDTDGRVWKLWRDRAACAGGICRAGSGSRSVTETRRPMAIQTNGIYDSAGFIDLGKNGLPKPFFDCIRQNNQDEEAFIVALSARLQAERDAASEQMSLSDQIKKKVKKHVAPRKK